MVSKDLAPGGSGIAVGVLESRGDTTARKTKIWHLLDGITADEGLAVLRTLLRHHPDLTTEAEVIATTFASRVDRQAVAKDIVDAVSALGFEELNARAGR